MRTHLGTIGHTEIFMRETRTDGVYSAGDRVIVRNTSTGRERTLSPQQARRFFSHAGVHLIPGQHLDSLRGEIASRTHGAPSGVPSNLASASQFLNVANYGRALAALRRAQGSHEINPRQFNQIHQNIGERLAEVRGRLLVVAARSDRPTPVIHRQMAMVDRWMTQWIRLLSAIHPDVHSNDVAHNVLLSAQHVYRLL